MMVKSMKVMKNLVDDFSDMTIHAEQSLKDIWDNDEDEIWNNL